jgi:hypothetical protein
MVRYQEILIQQWCELTGEDRDAFFAAAREWTATNITPKEMF